MSYGRKKSQSQGSNYNNNNNQQRGKPRFSHGGQNNRPRKNYGAMREKYLAQARDALAAGDRVLAENYFQHADHCYRMLAEEQASRPQRHNPVREQQAVDNAAAADVVAEETLEGDAAEADDTISMNVTSLPSFLTANYTPPKKAEEEAVPAPNNWEEE